MVERMPAVDKGDVDDEASGQQTGAMGQTYQQPQQQYADAY